MRFLIVVPTEALQNQWQVKIDNNGLQFNCDIWVINTASKRTFVCDCLILDECHRVPAKSFVHIFNTVKYKYILGLTATFERLDGRDKLLAVKSPVIDTITTEEALLNGWISPFKEYLVLIDVPDLDVYQKANREFTEHFQFFNYDFGLAMACLGKDGYKTKIQLRDSLLPKNATLEQKKDLLKLVNIHTFGFTRALQARKSFINNHPKKIEIARKILNARKDSKIITFSNNVKMAEAIEGGNNVYTGKTSKKKGRIMLDDFNNQTTGVINSCAKLNEGLDVKGLSVAIVLGLDSSKIKAVQRRGRTIRFEPGKTAEIFNIVINNTQELKWFQESHKDSKYITIDEKGLDAVLRGEEPPTYVKPVQKFMFRY